MSAIETLSSAKTIIIKIGSVLIANKAQGTVKQGWIDAFAQDVHTLTQRGKRVIIVSSGAVALGRSAIGVSNDAAPSSIPLEKKQAASAVGQFHLFNSYYQAFSALGTNIAQVLLTMSETENRRMHLNARATLSTLLDNGVIPIINENDTISTGEIRFGDNDRLAARVAQMIGADAVILMSTIDGLYTDNPDINPQAQHIAVIDAITDSHVTMAGEAVPGLSTGGMKSKLEAARTSTMSGIPLIIANGMEKHSLQSLLSDKTVRSSLFYAQETQSTARKRWIQAHLKPKGSVFIDNGALKALNDGKSLLPIGVHSIDGAFERGDAVAIKDIDGKQLGVGLSAYSSRDAQKIIGQQSANISKILDYAGREEIIHRNDMALQD